MARHLVGQRRQQQQPVVVAAVAGTGSIVVIALAAEHSFELDPGYQNFGLDLARQRLGPADWFAGPLHPAAIVMKGSDRLVEAGIGSCSCKPLAFDKDIVRPYHTEVAHMGKTAGKSGSMA